MEKKIKKNIRWTLVVYDVIIYAIAAFLMLKLYGGNDPLTSTGIVQQGVLSLGCILALRLTGKVYGQVWRYGGIQCYIRLVFTDMIIQNHILLIQCNWIYC